MGLCRCFGNSHPIKTASQQSKMIFHILRCKCNVKSGKTIFLCCEFDTATNPKNGGIIRQHTVKHSHTHPTYSIFDSKERSKFSIWECGLCWRSEVIQIRTLLNNSSTWKITKTLPLKPPNSYIKYSCGKTNDLMKLVLWSRVHTVKPP